MNKHEFFELISLLKSVYGEDTYPKPVIIIWYENLGHVKKEKLEKAFKRAIADNPNPRYPPSLAKVEIALSHIRDEIYEKEKKDIRENSLSSEEVSNFFKDLRIKKI